MQRFRGKAHQLEFFRWGIQVENQLVGIFEFVATTKPNVRRDACLICEVNKCRRVIANYVVDLAALFSRSRHTRDPTRKIIRHVLLKKSFALDSVWMTAHRQWTISHMRQHGARHAPEVIDHFALSDLGFRKKDFVLVRDLDVVAADLHWSNGVVE